MNKKVILECKNLYKIYKHGNSSFTILNNISFKVEEGEMISIIGASGSGKSTLLHILGGLDIPSSGEVIINNQTLKNISNKKLSYILNNDLGFIYQFHHLLPDFTILENIYMPLLINKIKKKVAEEKAYKMLIKIGLVKIANFYPSEISGGEKQRISVARALINNPKLVLADEPTGNLDQKNAHNIFNLIKYYNKSKNTTFLIVTHDLFLSKKLNRRMKMNNSILYNDH